MLAFANGRALFAGLALLSAACTPLATPEPTAEIPAGPATPKGGSRLKARYQALANSPKTLKFVGFHDSVRDEACTFQLFEDGDVRCMPSAYTGREVFSDARCETQVALEDACTGSHVAPAGSIGPCGDFRLSTIREIDASRSIDAIYTKLGDTCVKAVVPVGMLAHPFGDTVPRSAFVGASLQRILIDPRMTLAVAHGEDGSQSYAAIVTENDAVCNFFPANTEEGAFLLCGALPIPRSYASGGAYVDASCTQHGAVTGMPDSCDAAPYVLFTATDGRVSLFTRGPSQPGFEGDPSRCSPRSAGLVYPLKEPIAVTTSGLAPYLTLREDGTGRGQLRRAFAPDGTSAYDLDFRDRGDGTATRSCLPTAFADGVTRCIPFGAGADASANYTYFSDDRCTARVVVRPLPGPEIVVDGADRCNLAPDAFRLGAATPATTVYARSGAACTPVSVLAGSVYPIVGTVPGDDVWLRVDTR